MDYQLTIKVPLEAMDDLQAREVAKSILYDVGAHLLNEKTEKKLQRVYNPTMKLTKVTLWESRELAQ